MSKRIGRQYVPEFEQWNQNVNDLAAATSRMAFDATDTLAYNPYLDTFPWPGQNPPRQQRRDVNGEYTRVRLTLLDEPLSPPAAAIY
jgi:hypothetical protein